MLDAWNDISDEALCDLIEYALKSIGRQVTRLESLDYKIPQHDMLYRMIKYHAEKVEEHACHGQEYKQL